VFEGEVKSVEMHHTEVPKAVPGDNIGFKPSAHTGGKEGEVKSVEMHHTEVPKAVPGDNIGFKPSAHTGGKEGEVKSVEMHHTEVPKAVPGDNIGFNCRGISHTDIRRGDVGGPLDDPPSVARAFKAQVMILDHPNVIRECILQLLR
jgi:translation elongation factor EF-1alpha